MTITQTFALISLIVMAVFLIYLGYRFGNKDGKNYGLELGMKLGRSGLEPTVRQLQEKLDLARRDYLRLDRQYHCARANAKLGQAERETLLQIASKLKVASATFGAINAKAHTEQTMQLREKALALAELIEPSAQERAA